MRGGEVAALEARRRKQPVVVAEGNRDRNIRRNTCRALEGAMQGAVVRLAEATGVRLGIGSVHGHPIGHGRRALGSRTHEGAPQRSNSHHRGDRAPRGDSSPAIELNGR